MMLDRDWRSGLRYKSRARAAWPFEVLRRAAARGGDWQAEGGAD